MGLFDKRLEPKQTRNKKGQFTVKHSPPKPSARIKRAKVAEVRHLATRIPFSPQGFMGEPKYLKKPTRPMGLKEKKKWWAEQQKKGEARTKVRTKRAIRRGKSYHKALKRAWSKVW